MSNSQIKRGAAILERWVARQVKKANAEGIVFGLSGGVDSAVVAAIAKAALPNGHLAVTMHIGNSALDERCAAAVAKRFGLDLAELDLRPAFAALRQSLGLDGRRDAAALGNLKARLRAISLYALAQRRGYLVCGTSNRDEWVTGYFTKYGDSACDIAPLRNCLKKDVYALARHYGVPAAVIRRAPTAGLARNQTDEADLGMSYAELDAHWLKIKPLGEAKLARLEALRKNSAHKRKLPPAPRPFRYLR